MLALVLIVLPACSRSQPDPAGTTAVQLSVTGLTGDGADSQVPASVAVLPVAGATITIAE
ncbi:hypothetical protein [Aquisalimonas sp.]|uniref:hypothetical protein n=1 Tax=Aquisalimonas sp. TaxID=1872621 RepID=UPI0025BDBF89|nr:hypothetical protein [Aquisalimonas sp.]